jgi:hypothetical protein
MERIATGYLDRAGGQLFLIRAFMELGAYGFFAPSVFMDSETGLPRLDLRSAVGCYPDPDWKPGMTIRKCIFARDVYRHPVAGRLPGEDEGVRGHQQRDHRRRPEEGHAGRVLR